jgi:hypothetical protein
MSGLEAVIPDKIPGAVAVFLMFAGAAWILIFIGRLLYAPYATLKAQCAQLAAANETLLEIARDRPFTYVTTNFKIIKNGPAFAIARVDFLFENVGDKILLFKVKDLFLEYAGVKIAIPLSTAGETYIHAKKTMLHGFDLEGLSVQNFPVIISVGFDVEYDNFPALRVRGTKRVIQHTFKSFEPLEWSNLITHQEEY